MKVITTVLDNKNGLFKNADFEQGLAGWHCQGCSASSSSDAVSGKKSLKITQRQGTWAGPAQNFNYGSGRGLTRDALTIAKLS